MAALVTEVGNGLISVERDGETVTGITTGIPTNSFTIRKLASGRRDNGWITRGDELVEWHSRGLMEHSGHIYATGPEARGIFVDDALRDKTRDRVKDLVTIASALATLSGADISIGQIHTRCMLLLEDGGALVLPPDIAQAIREHQDLPGRLRTTELFNHPDQDPSNNAGFFLATITYFVLTGGYPFVADTAEELHGRIRSGKPVHARHRCLTLRTDISDTLASTLSGTAYESSPAVWAQRILRWSEEGFEAELAEAEREAARVEAEAEIQKIDRLFVRNESVRKNWRKWLIIAGIIVAVGAVPATIIRTALQPRATEGLLPDQVVTVFYSSVNSLDHMTMEDAVVDKAGRALVREVTNMFVIDRQRMGVEMRSALVDAKVWREEGMPPIEDNRTPYGTYNISLEPLDAPENEAAFRATYERWLPVSAESPDGPQPLVSYIGYLMTDELRLRMDKEDWVIYEITSLSVEELDMDLLRQESGPVLTDQPGS
jgi:hypothetical protein